MRRKVTVLFALALTVVMPAAAQQSLSDIAGSITLKRSAGEPVVVDGSSLTSTTAASSSSLSAELEEVLTDSRETLQGVSSLLAGMPRISPVSYSDELRGRLGALELELETARNNVAMFFGVKGYQEVVDEAELAVAESQEALGAAQTAVAGGRLASNEARDQAARAVNRLGDALTRLGVLERTRAAAQPPPAIDPIAADASIRGLCGQSYTEGGDRFQDCVSRQLAAIDNIRARSALASGVDQSAFNTIRNQCRLEWVHDYVARDGCERRRVAAAGGR
jgi:hypothetical protein